MTPERQQFIERQARLSAFLYMMGRTADEVAEFMTRHGIKGRRHHPSCCPVAVALGRKFRGIPNPSNNAYDAGERKLDGTDDVRVQIPPAVASFTKWFDAGMYPHLIQGES